MHINLNHIYRAHASVKLRNNASKQSPIKGDE